MSNTNPLVPVAYQNTNSIVVPEVLEYANRYQTFLNKTAESILSLTETVYDAKKNLSDDEFIQFKEEVGLKSKATVSKFLSIGENVSRLRPYKDRLPHAWTTLLRLVKLSNDDFLKIEKSLSPDMTASSIDKLLNHNVTQGVKDVPDIKLYLNKLEFGQKKGFLKKLTELMKSYQVDFKTSGDFTIEVKKIRGSTAAWILQFPNDHQYPEEVINAAE